MTWNSHKYYTESETHRICRTFDGTQWCLQLWDRQTKQYIAKRYAATLDEQKAAIEELKGVASDCDRV